MGKARILKQGLQMLRCLPGKFLSLFIELSARGVSWSETRTPPWPRIWWLREHRCTIRRPVRRPDVQKQCRRLKSGRPQADSPGGPEPGSPGPLVPRSPGPPAAGGACGRCPGLPPPGGRAASFLSSLQSVSAGRPSPWRTFAHLFGPNCRHLPGRGLRAPGSGSHRPGGSVSVRGKRRKVTRWEEARRGRLEENGECCPLRCSCLSPRPGRGLLEAK